MTQAFGVVVIGRNEGDRLLKCLDSLAGYPVVYVDSGSTDNSVAESEKRGVTVVELDLSVPFTAARARNAGAETLLETFPELEFVQFVDGDCQVAERWLERASQELQENPALAAVCGRRREVNRGASVYNLLCDIEWDTPVGHADACGGDAMYRVRAYQAAGGFNEDFIAGEEPELCYRLRRAGWRIKRIDQEMTKHDAAMHHFKQWWKRSQRSGYAYALGALEHGSDQESYKLKPCLSVLFWAGAVPVAALVAAVVSPGLALLGILLAYLYLGMKVYRSSRKRHPGFTPREIGVYSLFLVLQKFPELVGMLQCGWQHMLGRRMSIIEYK
jgi:GT2 family glycosyltransferase